MYVTKDVTLIHKINSVTYTENQTVIVRLETGVLDTGIYSTIQGTNREVVIPAGIVEFVLDSNPEVGLTRREDTAKMVYTYLLDTGVISGTIV